MRKRVLYALQRSGGCGWADGWDRLGTRRLAAATEAEAHLKLSRLLRSVPSAMQRAEWHSASWLPGPTIHAFWDAKADAFAMNLGVGVWWVGGGALAAAWALTAVPEGRTR